MYSTGVPHRSTVFLVLLYILLKNTIKMCRIASETLLDLGPSKPVIHLCRINRKR